MDKRKLYSKRISGLCRICFEKSIDIVEIHERLIGLSQNDITVYKAMEVILGTNIAEKHLNYICFKCCENLKIAFDFKIKCEQAEKKIRQYFKNESSNTQKVLKEKEEEKASVEIISRNGIFDLKDLFVIEKINKNNEKPHTFKGFLNNLGSEVSVEFVYKNGVDKKLQKFTDVTSISIQKVNNNNLDQKVKSTDYFTCRKCKTSFPDKKTLRKHQRGHREDKHLCQLCGKISRTKQGIKNHILKHKDKMFECKMCGKKYYYKSNLLVHIKVVHFEEKAYLCTHCGKRFGYATALEYHMRLHSGEKKYICSYCPRRFTMLNSLKRHICTHTGARPFECRYCIKAFKSRGELKCHEMTHTGDRPYTCEYCGKGFTKTHNLKVHLMAHPGPYMCHRCSKTFVDPKCLNKHLKTSHGIVEEEIETLEY